MPEKRDVRSEYLLVRGRLDRTGRFTPRRCTSTPFVHEWPRGSSAEELAELGVGAGGEIVVETVAEGDRLLHRELAQVRPQEVCAPGEAPTFRVEAYIGLHPDAVVVRLTRDERVLWEMRIPEPAEVRVGLERAPERVERRRKPSDEESEQHERRRTASTAVLQVEWSPPADEELAFVTVVFQWSERGYRTVYLGPPTSPIDVDTYGLAGGPECRFLVTYSNGLRGASAATDSFSLEEEGPSVTILRPSDGDQVVAWTPVILEGFAEDPEHPSAPRDVERLVWAVDGEQVAVGPSASVDGIEEGRHEVTLTYRGEREAQATVTLDVAKSDRTTAAEWEDWDPVELG